MPHPRGVVSVLIVLLAFAGPAEVRADVPWVPYFEGEYLASVELLTSAEHSLAGGLSVALWGGVAYVYTRQEEIGIHTTGLEAAIEPRWYLAGHDGRGLFVGAYLGVGSMRTPEYYRSSSRDRVWVTGVARGLKLGYKLEAFRAGSGRVLAEPYLSLSKATYSGAGYLEHESSWLKTLGLRFVWGFDI